MNNVINEQKPIKFTRNLLSVNSSTTVEIVVGNIVTILTPFDDMVVDRPSYTLIENNMCIRSIKQTKKQREKSLKDFTLIHEVNSPGPLCHQLADSLFGNPVKYLVDIGMLERGTTVARIVIEVDHKTQTNTKKYYVHSYSLTGLSLEEAKQNHADRVLKLPLEL